MATIFSLTSLRENHLCLPISLVIKSIAGMTKEPPQLLLIHNFFPNPICSVAHWSFYTWLHALLSWGSFILFPVTLIVTSVLHIYHKIYTLHKIHTIQLTWTIVIFHSELGKIPSNPCSYIIPSLFNINNWCFLYLCSNDCEAEYFNGGMHLSVLMVILILSKLLGWLFRKIVSSHPHMWSCFFLFRKHRLNTWSGVGSMLGTKEIDVKVQFLHFRAWSLEVVLRIADP